jgi:hypothetical protein
LLLLLLPSSHLPSALFGAALAYVPTHRASSSRRVVYPRRRSSRIAIVRRCPDADGHHLDPGGIRHPLSLERMGNAPLAPEGGSPHRGGRRDDDDVDARRDESANDGRPDDSHRDDDAVKDDVDDVDDEDARRRVDDDDDVNERCSRDRHREVDDVNARRDEPVNDGRRDDSHRDDDAVEDDACPDDVYVEARRHDDPVEGARRDGDSAPQQKTMR